MIVTCEDLAKKLTDLEEGPASSVMRASMKFHLSICARCRRYVAELRAIRQSLAEVRTSSPLAEDAGRPDTGLGGALSTFRAWTAGHEATDEDP